MKTATLNIVENILENRKKTISVESGIKIEDVLKKNLNGVNYTDMYVEVYDCETGVTSYEPLESDSDTINAVVVVNGKDQSLDYIVNEDDVINVIYLPASNDVWDTTTAVIGNMLGSMAGALLGAGVAIAFGWNVGVALLVGAAICGTIGLLVGGFLPAIKDWLSEDAKDPRYLDKENLPDTRGSNNTNLTNNVFPAVMGKHLTTPFIAGSTYNDIYGAYGEDIYINALYLVGYAPLKITDLKLGDQFLAHNQSWGDVERDTVFHGVLQGVNTSEDGDLGDITSVWESNDVKVEILQQGQNGEAIDYGTIYPYAVLQDDINANVLHICDKTLEEEPLISYKGVSLAHG